MNIKVIILDFDGVIVESVGIKDRAFEYLFQPYEDHLTEIMDYHLKHNAVIRFEKFEHIYKNILKLEYTDAVKESLCKRYSEFCVSRIVACPYVQGAMEFIEYFYPKVPLYLASVNPPEEFKSVLKQRKIDHYFKGVYNVPWKKADAINDILEKENLAQDQAVFVGDSPEDRAEAEKADILFVGRQSNKDLGRDNPVFKDMDAVKSFIETL